MLALLVLAAGTPAGATSVERPTGPFVVANDAAGRPQPFTVVASGFRAGTLAYVEQCDGAPLQTPGWTPALHCDLGSAPAPVVVTRDGTATFDVRNRNHAFHPFRGESPQSLFNCLAAGDRIPANGLPAFRNCRIRVSSNNSTATDDQTFLTVTLTRVPGVTLSVAAGAPSSASAAAASDPVTAAPGSAAAAAGSSAVATNSSQNSHLAYTGAETLLVIRLGYVTLLAGMLLARTRRTRVAR